jgi:conjugal transfer pilus assembly protein TraV
LRLWIKPWEDADGDLNGESVVYLQVEGGRWLVDHAQRQVREPYAPVRALGPRTPSASKVSQAQPPSSAEATARPAVPNLPAIAAAAVRAAQEEQPQQVPSADGN